MWRANIATSPACFPQLPALTLPGEGQLESACSSTSEVLLSERSKEPSGEVSTDTRLPAVPQSLHLITSKAESQLLWNLHLGFYKA